jgi:hypothetical protein
MMTDRAILQSPSGSSADLLTFPQAAEISGVLRNIVEFVKSLGSYSNDDMKLTSYISRLLDMYHDSGRLCDDTYNWLDSAEFEYNTMMYDNQENIPQEWYKVLHIVHRHLEFSP